MIQRSRVPSGFLRQPVKLCIWLTCGGKRRKKHMLALLQKNKKKHPPSLICTNKDRFMVHFFYITLNGTRYIFECWRVGMKEE